MAEKILTRAEFCKRIQDKPVYYLDEILGCGHWEKQDEILNSVFEHQRTTVKSCHGIGKCLGKGTPILMLDGTIKAVEDIVIGDIVMGMDSTPRKVLDLMNGREKMFLIRPKKGDSFLVTGNHRLTLRKGGSEKFKRGPIPNGTIIDISVNDYLRKDVEFKTRYNLFKVPIDFSSSEVPIDAYFFGLWLGDGSISRAGITTMDNEIKEYTYKIAEKYGCGININQNKTKTCPTYIVTKGNQKKKRNMLLEGLQKLGVTTRKHIPLIYKTSSRKDRLDLLAGLIDTDGSLESNCYTITQKSQELINDIAFVARSLGFFVTIRKVQKTIKSIGFSGDYYIAIISGDIDTIPVLLERKIATKRVNEKNVLNVGFSVEEAGENEYFGFQVDKDERFLLGDFTVTHNSYISARIGQAFLFAHEDSIVVTTAPTFRQVENILWKEFRSAAAKAKKPLGGNMLKTKYEIAEKWYAIGISSDKEDNFQGFHAEHILVIVDEAAGVPESTMQVIEALMTSKGAHLLLIGNPTNTNGGFYDSHKSPLYHKISISCFDTPNFQSEGIRNINQLMSYTREELEALVLPAPWLITPLWAFERAEAWGIDSPMFQARVMGVFPEEGDDTLIKLSHIEAALRKEWDEEEWKFRPRRNVIGIDVARHGSDTTVLIPMDNGKMLDKGVWYTGKDTMVTVGHAIAMFNDLGWNKEFDYFVVDDTGVGGGVTDRLLELGYNVIAVNNASTEDVQDKERFRDIKAEIFWMLREAFIHGDIGIEGLGRIVSDLSRVKYDYTSQGKIFIKSKKDMKKNGEKSPDFADALALAFYGSCMIDSGDAVVVTSKSDDGDSENGTIVGDIFHQKF